VLKRIEAWPKWIVAVSGAALFAGLFNFAVWAATGEERFLRSFFDGPGLSLLIALPAVELGFSILALCSFGPGEPLRRGWFLIASSSGCRLAGALASQIFGGHSWLNPLAWGGWVGDPGPIRGLGLAMGGPLWMALLAAGLWLVLRVYRRLGVWARLKWIDWVAVAITAGFAAFELSQVLRALQAGKHLTPLQIADLANDPLLSLLVLEALLIRRSVLAMGHGLVARCWGAFATGILLTCLGSIGMWATHSGHLRWAPAGLTWYVWFPAAAAFALGPLYQTIAVRRAHDRVRQALANAPGPGGCVA
jgi:hypothetical protein